MTQTKRGRPRIEIDKREFESLLVIQCSLEEITQYFDSKLGGCSEDTIERWCKRTYKQNFADVAAQKRKIGWISLRRKQYELAMAGDKTLLIWLGRNWLGQRDTVEVKTEAGESTIEQIAKMIMGEKKDGAT